MPSIYPLDCLVIQTRLTSAFITTSHSFSSVFMTKKTLIPGLAFLPSSWMSWTTFSRCKGRLLGGGNERQTNAGLVLTAKRRIDDCFCVAFAVVTNLSIFDSVAR